MEGMRLNMRRVILSDPVLILRRSLNAARDLLAHWDFWAADPPRTLSPWQVGETLPDSVHDVWLRPNSPAAWKMQLMIEEAVGVDRMGVFGVPLRV